MINYKLIVSDFDGTLLNDKHEIPLEVEQAIKQYVADGGTFAVCTGRMLKSILPRVRAIGLKGIVVGYQGSIIAEIESGKILKMSGFSTADAVHIAQTIENQGYDMQVYCNDKLYTTLDDDNKMLKTYESITGIKAEQIFDKDRNKCKPSKFINQNLISPQKFTCLINKYEQKNVYKTLSELLGEKFDVTCSADILVEVSPKSDNKGEALKFIADYYGIPIANTVAIGDQLNDLSMIKAAGVGVAVGNAVEELKQAARFVATTNNNFAVAQIIKKYGFA